METPKKNLFPPQGGTTPTLMGDRFMGGQLPHFWIRDFFLIVPLKEKPMKYVTKLLFLNFGEKNSQKLIPV